jgi:hypothetical protein
LSQRVHLGLPEVALFGVLGLARGTTGRAGRLFTAGQKPQDA